MVFARLDELPVLAPIVYGFGMIVLFAVLYRAIGVYKHFVITDEQSKSPWFASFYISAMAQSNAMGDATPKTILARSLFGAQVVLGWMWVVTFAVLVAGSVKS